MEIITQNSPPSTGESEAIKAPSLLPVLISFAVHGGYDDNSTTTPNGAGSWFTDEQLTLSYDHSRGPTQLQILAGVGAVERFSLGTDVNAFLDLSFTRSVSERLTLVGKIDATYTPEPDFSSNVGPSRRAGGYIDLTDGLSAAYQWSRRISTVTSFSFRLIRYDDSFTAAFTDREEYTFGEEYRYALFRDTVLIADYRYLVVDYVTFPFDSITHFVLAGVEQSFSQRLQAQLRAGPSFRSFNQGDDRIDPKVEGSVTYALGRHSSISSTAGYSIEEASAGASSVQTTASSVQTTFRAGVQFRYGITPRISSAIGFNYHHDENQAANTTAALGSGSSTDAYDVLLSLRYQISRHVDFDVGFQHSDVSSFAGVPGYTRNRYSLGLSVTF